MIKRLAPVALLFLAACTGAGTNATTGGPVTGADSRAADEQLALMAPPAPGTFAPARLKGMGAGALQHVLGRPSFIRRDPPAEIWQYRVRACTLDLFLYDETDRKAVAHYAVRTPNGGTVSDQACLDEILARRDGPPTS